MYACKNRGEFAPSVTVQDGKLNSWAPRMVEMPFRMSKVCEYVKSDLGEKDKGCDGCIWKAGAGTSSPDSLGADEYSLGNLRQGEGGPSGVGGQADVGRSSDVAEHGSTDQQARAAEKLEAIYPGAAMYRPIQPTKE